MQDHSQRGKRHHRHRHEQHHHCNHHHFRRCVEWWSTFQHSPGRKYQSTLLLRSNTENVIIILLYVNGVNGGDDDGLTTQVVKPTTTKRIAGYGLPLPKVAAININLFFSESLTNCLRSRNISFFTQEPTRRGDILVSFDIQVCEKDHLQLLSLVSLAIRITIHYFQFPDRLSQNTKDLLHDLLPPV